MVLEQYLAYLPQNHFLRAGIILVIAWAVMWLILYIFEKVFLKLAKNTKTQLDDLIVGHLKLPLAVSAFLIGARIAVEALVLPEGIQLIIERIINSLLIIAAAYVVVSIIDVLLEHWGKSVAKRTKSSVDDDLVSLGKRVVKIVLYIMAILYVLQAWGFEVGPMLASLGIAGIAVAFALQNTLANIFGGVSLIMDKTFKVGDIIQLEDGSLGTVMKVSIRSTKIKTFDNELMTIPNGKLADSKIVNWIQPTAEIRVNINFGVEYGSDIDKVKKVVMDVINKEKEAMKEPAPQILFLAMADSSLNFIARFFVDDISKKLEAKDRVSAGIYNALNKAKIGIPFPQMDVHLKKK